MSLSIEDKKRLGEEEAYREKVREGLGLSSKQNKPIWKKWWFWVILIFVSFFIIRGMGGDTNNNKTEQPRAKEQNAVNTNTLVTHEVLPFAVQGTLRRIIVIIPDTITKEQIVALNDKLRSDYSVGLTHLFIDYFDNKAVSVDFFKRVSAATEKEADKMYSHYRAKYIMNKQSGYDELDFNENNMLGTLKKY